MCRESGEMSLDLVRNKWHYSLHEDQTGSDEIH